MIYYRAHTHLNASMLRLLNLYHFVFTYTAYIHVVSTSFKMHMMWLFARRIAAVAVEQGVT